MSSNTDFHMIILCGRKEVGKESFFPEAIKVISGNTSLFFFYFVSTFPGMSCPSGLTLSQNNFLWLQTKHKNFRKKKVKKKRLKGYLSRKGEDFLSCDDKNGIICNAVYLALRGNNYVLKPKCGFCVASVDFILSGCLYAYR